MSVVGFDIGNQSCFITAARQGGLETVPNEAGDRRTPTYVSFGEKDRAVGMSAKSQSVSNMQNTVYLFKRFLDASAPIDGMNLNYRLVKDSKGATVVKVFYIGEEVTLTPIQIMAVMLAKLKKTAEIYLNAKVVDCVISVPNYFNDRERRALLDASRVANLNCLRIMNDTTAAALAWGVPKKELPASDAASQYVAFVDFGYTGLQVAVCGYNQGKLKVLATSAHPDIGGQAFDMVLVKYFAEEFKTKYKLDVFSKKRAVLKLTTECERLRKLMSANAERIPLNIECFMEDKDVSSSIDRATFEDLIAPLLSCLKSTMEQAISDSGVAKEDLSCVEMIGGCSRTPVFKQLVIDVFGKPPQTTLNADEAVARGCALQCAILSPTFKVRDFSISDVQPYPISISWMPTSNRDPGHLLAFEKFYTIPSARKITLERYESFNVAANYELSPTTKDNPRLAIDPALGTWSIQNVVPKVSKTDDGKEITAPAKIKLKVKINLHGIFSVSSAVSIDKVAVPVTPKPKTDEKPVSGDVKEVKEKQGEEKMNTDAAPAPSEKMDVDSAPQTAQETTETPAESAEKVPTENGPAASEANPEQMDESPAAQPEDAPSQPEIKYKTVQTDLPIESVVPSLDNTTLHSLLEIELKMQAQDKQEKERLDAKNAVEEYMYEMRRKISEELEPFMLEKDREQFSELLTKTEDWLYDFEDLNKEEYMKKLAELKHFGEPASKRYAEFQMRPQAISAFEQSLAKINMALHLYEQKDEKYAHLEKAEIEKVVKYCQEKLSWYDKNVGPVRSIQRHENPSVLSSQIETERRNLEAFCNPILSKPKPKPPAEKPPPDSKENGNKKETQENANTNQNTETTTTEETRKEQEPAVNNTNDSLDMDLD